MHYLCLILDGKTVTAEGGISRNQGWKLSSLIFYNNENTNNLKHELKLVISWGLGNASIGGFHLLIMVSAFQPWTPGSGQPLDLCPSVHPGLLRIHASSPPSSPLPAIASSWWTGNVCSAWSKTFNRINWGWVRWKMLQRNLHVWQKGTKSERCWFCFPRKKPHSTFWLWNKSCRNWLQAHVLDRVSEHPGAFYGLSQHLSGGLPGFSFTACEKQEREAQGSRQMMIRWWGVCLRDLPDSSVSLPCLHTSHRDLRLWQVCDQDSPRCPWFECSV